MSYASCKISFITLPGIGVSDRTIYPDSLVVVNAP